MCKKPQRRQVFMLELTSHRVDNLIAEMGLDFNGANSRDDVMLIARIAEQSD